MKLQADVERPRRLARRRQVRVSFSGLDGAGKSTQIAALVTSLEDEQRRAVVLWLPFRFWPERLKDAVPKRLLRKMRPKKDGELIQAETPEVSAGSSEAASTEVRSGSVSTLRRAFWATTATASAISTGMSLRRRMSAGQGDVVVLDRYRLDTLVKLCWVYPTLPQRWLAAIMRAVAPRPDLEVLFRVEPEVAFARKIDRVGEEWTLDQLTKHARLYDELVAGSRTVLILDAARDPENLARDVWSHVRPLLDGR